jgi:hypothetical protein
LKIYLALPVLKIKVHLKLQVRSLVVPSFKHHDMKAYGETVVYLRTLLISTQDSGEWLVKLYYRVDPGNKLL